MDYTINNNVKKQIVYFYNLLFLSLKSSILFIWLYKNIVINSHFTPPLSKKTIADLNCNHSFRGYSDVF